uniref:Ankyrin repeat protein n=1 Tax=viral metagenome TaxID=1070528 RepID=A0A6C0AD84_9ZZZZ
MTENLEILKYLNSFYENGIFYFFNKEDLELLYITAIENENLNILKNIDSTINIVKTKLHFNKALITGNLEILKYLNLCYQIDFDFRFKINLEILKYLIKRSCKTNGLKLNKNHIIYFFLKNDLESLNYIFSISQSYFYFENNKIIEKNCNFEKYMIEIIPIEYRNIHIDEKNLIKEYLKDKNIYDNYSWLTYYLINSLTINSYIYNLKTIY